MTRLYTAASTSHARAKQKKYSNGTPPFTNPGSAHRQKRRKKIRAHQTNETSALDSNVTGGGCSLELRQVRVYILKELGLAHGTLLDVEHLPALDDHERWQAMHLVLLDCPGGKTTKRRRGQQESKGDRKHEDKDPRQRRRATHDSPWSSQAPPPFRYGAKNATAAASSART